MEKDKKIVLKKSWCVIIALLSIISLVGTPLITLVGGSLLREKGFGIGETNLSTEAPQASKLLGAIDSTTAPTQYSKPSPPAPGR
jgi:hypothetical protein